MSPWSPVESPPSVECAKLRCRRISTRKGHNRAPNPPTSRGRCHQRRRRARDGRDGRRTGVRCDRRPRRRRRSPFRSTTARPVEPTTRTSRASTRTPRRTAHPSTSTCRPARRSMAPRQSEVSSLDPACDHEPGDEFTPCADHGCQRLRLSRKRRSTTWATSWPTRSWRWTRSTSARWMPADPSEAASDSLVMIVYNVQDANYYDCAETTYTAGYFAPEFIDSSGMNVDRHRRVRLGEPCRAGGLALGTTTTQQRPADALRGRHRPRAGASADELQRPG